MFDVYRVSDTWPNLCKSSKQAHISSCCLILFSRSGSVLGFPRSTQEFIYFNRTDVQDAIHAPHVNWMACTNTNVYVNTTTGRAINDQSIPSTLSVLPNVIEKSVRTVIVHGLSVWQKYFEHAWLLSTELPANPVGLHSRSRRYSYCHSVSIFFSYLEAVKVLKSNKRNMTWNGAQGFQTPIEPETFSVNNFGVFGNTHSERGLTCEFFVRVWML